MTPSPVTPPPRRVFAMKVVKQYTIPTNGRRFALVEMSNGHRVDVVTRYDRGSLPLYATAAEIKRQAERQWYETRPGRTTEMFQP